MEVRWGGGDVNRTRTFAKELVALQPDVILAQGTPGTAALQRETRTIPIVFVVVADPVGPGAQAGRYDLRSRHGAWTRDILLPRFRGCCPVVQIGSDRSGGSQRLAPGPDRLRGL